MRYHLRAPIVPGTLHWLVLMAARSPVSAMLAESAQTLAGGPSVPGGPSGFAGGPSGVPGSCPSEVQAEASNERTAKAPRDSWVIEGVRMTTTSARVVPCADRGAIRLDAT